MNKYKNNLIKFLNLVLTVFSGLALVYLIYRSEFHNDGSKLYYYWKAYLIFSFLFLFSIFIFFISLEKREKILIFFYSIILSFYIVEFFLVINSGYFTKHFFFDDSHLTDLGNSELAKVILKEYLKNSNQKACLLNKIAPD